MNELIKYVAAIGLSDQMSSWFSLLSFIPTIVLCCVLGRKMKTGIMKLILLMAFVYLTNYLLMLVLTWIELGFKYFGAQNGIRSFAYTPLLCGVGAKIFGIEWKQTNAVWAVCMPISHAVAHLGCIFAGCCEGYPCSWGIYNSFYDKHLFPIQIIESIVALIVFMYLLYRFRKNKYLVDGKEYPIMLVLFGSTKFICVFFRRSVIIWLGCSSLSFHSLFMCVVGLVWLAILKHKEKMTIQT